MRSKQGDPNSNKYSLTKTQRRNNAEQSSLDVDFCFLIKELSLGLGSLCVY